MSDVMELVPELLREAATLVLPAFRDESARPEEKAPGEWVTTADHAAESFLTPALMSLIPGSLVVGEEAASKNHDVLTRLTTGGWVWLLDPLDGTANFAAGVEPFSMMVALLREGEPIASWMHDPVGGDMHVAQRGSGAWSNGARVSTDPREGPLIELTGAVLRRFLPDPVAEQIAAAESILGPVLAGSRCAGHDYPSIVRGELDFALFWRSLPWDHVPGVLFLVEAGGKAARLDGAPYRASDHDRTGLLAAKNEAVWLALRDLFMPSDQR